MIKVYVAGKLNDMAVDYNKNRAKMMKEGLKLHKKGFSVFVPCLIEQIALIDGDWEYNDYFLNSQPWLMSSDAVYLVPGWETSKGTQDEVYTAVANGIPVFESKKKMVKFFKGQSYEFS